MAIMEVGLGGRLAAVNAFDADCAGTTSVALGYGLSRDYPLADRQRKAGILLVRYPAITEDLDSYPLR